MIDRPAPRLVGESARCRNCGSDAPGAYCPSCGQETTVRLPRIGEFVREAAGRLVALDGRLARTLYLLVFRPGVLTREYLVGRRRRYVRPARLILVLLLLVFAVIGVVRSPGSLDEDDASASAEGSAMDIATPDTGNGKTPQAANPSRLPAPGAASAAGSGVAQIEIDQDNFLVIDENLKVRMRLNGAERQLPAELRKRIERFRRMSEPERAEHVFAGVLRYGPYLVVMMLPLFALLLKLAYLGRTDRYPGRPRLYAEHLVYSAHLHSFAALMVLLLLVPYTPARVAIGAWIVYYVLRARNVVYGGRRWAGVLRAIVIAIAYTVAAWIAFAVLMLTSAVLR